MDDDNIQNVWYQYVVVDKLTIRNLDERNRAYSNNAI